MSKELFKSSLTKLMANILSSGLLMSAPFNAHAEVLELGVAIDASGSIGATNFETQRTIYKEVLSDANIVKRDGSIAVGVVVFESSANQVYPTTLVTEDTIPDLIQAIDTMPYNGGGTNIISAIEALASDISNNDIVSSRAVLDISTDGEDFFTTPELTQAVVDTTDIDQINCLGIGDSANCSFIAGEGAFAQDSTNDAESLRAAFTAKVLSETLEGVDQEFGVILGRNFVNYSPAEASELRSALDSGKIVKPEGVSPLYEDALINPRLTKQTRDLVNLFGVISNAGEAFDESNLEALNVTATSVSSLSLADEAAFWDSVTPKNLGAQVMVSKRFHRAHLGELYHRLFELRNKNQQFTVAKRFSYGAPKEPILLASAGNDLSVLEPSFRKEEVDPLIQQRFGFFITENYIVNNLDTTDSIFGHETDGNLLTFGVDYRLSKNMFLGTAVSISKADSNFDRARGEQEQDSQQFSVFGNYYFSPDLYADVILSYSDQDYETNRDYQLNGTTQRILSESDSDMWSVAVSSGAELLVKGWEVNPFVSLQWAKLSADSFRESNDFLALDIGGYKNISVQSSLGGRVQRSFAWKYGSLVPSADLSWNQEWRDQATAANASLASDPGAGAISLAFSPELQNFLQVGLSVDMVLAHNRNVFLRLESLQGDSDVDQTAASLGFRFAF